jgi:murein DD-endopeptidase MepM/ murein hydrolase activator NlpD
MAGKTSERILCICLILSVAFMLHACARSRVPAGKRPPSAEKKIVKTGVYHVVERHQTLYRICKTYGVDLEKIASLNRISDPGKIEVGQQIFIPGAKKVLKVEIYIEDVAAESPDMKEEKAVEKRPDFLWPIKGQLSNTFDNSEDSRHMGIDISSPLGTAIKAANSGKVLYSGNTVKGYGNLIILRHSNEFVTVYAHNQVNLVEEGAWVERGQVIGKVGQTGRASGPHLHFEIRKNNRAVNPFLYLK